MTNKKLRVGILVDKRDLLAWECVMLEKVAKSYYAEIVLIVHLNPAEKNDGPLRGFELVRRRHPGLLVLVLARKITTGLRTMLERKVGGYVPDAFQAVTGFQPFESIPCLDVTPTQTKFSDFISHADTERIRAFEVDLFIRMGSRILRGEMLNAAPYGVWSFHHGDNRINRGGPAGFWEVFYNSPLTGSTLQIVDENLDGGKVLSRTSSATCAVSVRRNKNSLYWTALAQLPRKLEELYLRGPASFFEKVERDNACPLIYSNRLFTAPTLAEEMALVCRISWRIYSNRIRDLFVASRWILLYQIGDESSPAMFRFKKIVPPPDRFWADPHVLIKDARYYIFIEEFHYGRNKGHISLIEMDPDGTHTMPRRVIEEPHHLSNPFVFEHEGQVFMIPESAKNRSVDLYRSVSFPGTWERCETLMENVYAVDTIVHLYRGKWWLFTSIREHEGGSSSDTLFLFYSDALQGGEWTSHPANPIVSDVTRARPGGKIFEYKGRLFRPAQDGSIRYGYGMRIHEILTLSETEYVEQEAVVIRPMWDKSIIATHTFSKAGPLIFTDGLEEKWKIFSDWRSAPPHSAKVN